MRLIATVVLIGILSGRLASAAEEPGTVGLSVAQLYNDQESNKRGILVVRRVEPGSAAAEAGIAPGDLILSIGGVSVSGRNVDEIVRQDLRGPAGGKVALSVVKSGGQPTTLVLTRKAYPPLLNPASDPFSYSVPGNWRMDLRYPFPLPWSPAIDHKGLEDLAFAPGFDDTGSPEYHSYLIVWWLEDSEPLTADRIQTDMLLYFRGLGAQRGRNRGFAPDLSKVSSEYHEWKEGPATFGGHPATNFAGTVNLYDTHGKVISLHSEVSTAVCAESGHMAVFFAMSYEARPGSLWSQLDAVRDGFKCSR